MPRRKKGAAEFILPLNINGLQGRMLRAPATSKKKREILLVYGHHANLERWWNLVENLRPYGNVTMPDMPGFGGMESFYNINKRPDIDTFADYMASFIKLRYKNKKITIFAISYGFVVMTRMFQRYPELANKVDLFISFAGFMNADNILYGKKKRWFCYYIARFLASRPIALFIRYVALNKLLLQVLYKTFPKSRRRMLEVTPEQFALNMDVELKLWKDNDVRTHWLTTSEFLRLNNLTVPIKLHVAHVISKNDHWLNNLKVEEHMRRVFNEYDKFVSKTKAHVPSVIADKKAMSVMVPPELKRVLNKKPK
jgi:pimeloyl-ACP methyl ester carboxylesterase